MTFPVRANYIFCRNHPKILYFKVVVKSNMETARSEQIKNIPSRPGVYLMKDRAGEVIYIGKAKNLNKRVSSYFQKKPYERKTEALISRIASVETIITDNEIEALILESTLVKKHRPRFNIELKDNNKYPYIKITMDEYPQITKTRIKKDDGALYFGPYPNVKYINRTLKTITDLFPIRRCGRKFEPGKKVTPCINYYLGKCICPLRGETSREEYRLLVDQVILFLKGQNAQLLTWVKQEMEEAAEKRNFEKAIYLRDRYTALRKILEDQKVSTAGGENEDIFGIANSGDVYNVTILLKRNGAIVGKRDFVVENRADEPDVLGRFLSLYYSDGAEQAGGYSPDLPEEILLPYRTGEMSTLKSYLKQKRGRTVALSVPQKGMKKRLSELAQRNARQKVRELLFRYNPQSSLLELKKLLRLARMPERIEGFDVATLLGSFSVASMVRFSDGMPDRKNYRRFRIRFTAGQNDVEMIKEAVGRRYQRLLNEKKPLPDLILVDGGKPQVNAAHEVLSHLALADVPLVGLAKQHEEIYPYGEAKPFSLEKGSDALRLLMAVRDEAHRFANSYHIRMRGKEAVLTKLREARGVGDSLIQKLLASGIPLNGEVSVESLRQVPGVGEKTARRIVQVLSKPESEPTGEDSSKRKDSPEHAASPDSGGS
jgi:excinuclease ABC subunit C